MSASIPALDLSVEADPGVPIRVLLSWPPGPTLLVHSIQAYVVMRRLGGIMLVVPDQVIEPGSLLEFSLPPEDGSEPLIGP